MRDIGKNIYNSIKSEPKRKSTSYTTKVTDNIHEKPKITVGDKK